MDHSHDQLHRNNPLSASSNPSSSSHSFLNASALPSQEHHHEHFVQPPPSLGSSQNQQQTLLTQRNHLNNPLSASSNPSSSSQSSLNASVLPSQEHHHVQPSHSSSQPRFLHPFQYHLSPPSEFLQPLHRQHLIPQSFSGARHNQLPPALEYLPPPQRRRLNTSLAGTWQNPPPPSQFIPPQPLSHNQYSPYPQLIQPHQQPVSSTSFLVPFQNQPASQFIPPQPLSQNQHSPYPQFIQPRQQPMSSSSLLVPFQNQPSPFPQFQPQEQHIRFVPFQESPLPQEHHHEQFFQQPPSLGSLQNQQQTLLTQNPLNSLEVESIFSEFLQSEEQEEPAQQEPSLTPTPPISKVYRWVVEKPATFPTLEHLMYNDFKTVAGDVLCKKCHYYHEHEFDPEKKFSQVLEFTQNNIKKIYSSKPPMEINALHQLWSATPLPTCNRCQNTDCLMPITPDYQEKINWLFLFLGGMLHLCTKSQLADCCRRYQIEGKLWGTKYHLFEATYSGLCKKVVPAVDFDWCKQLKIVS